MFGARENRNNFHQVLSIQPKTGHLVHFSYPATSVDVESQPAKELLNGLLSQWESVMPKCFLGTTKRPENIVELFLWCIDNISER